MTMAAHRHFYCRLLYVSIFVLSAASAWGDDEKWPGTLQLPNKGIKTIQFMVNASNEEILIKGLKYKDEYFEFSEVVWQQSALTFSWKPGQKALRCSLVRDDNGLFGGSCSVPDSSDSVKMTLRIPQEEEQEGDEDSADATEGSDAASDGQEENDGGSKEAKADPVPSVYLSGRLSKQLYSSERRPQGHFHRSFAGLEGENCFICMMQRS